MIKDKNLKCLGFTLLMWLVLAAELRAADFSVADTQLSACLQEIALSKQWSAPEEFITIKCHSENIQSLQGLARFSNVETLSLYNNQLRQLDIDFAQFKKLKQLNLARNNLEKVSLQGLPALEKLYLFSNRITELHLQDLAQLRELKTNNNALETFQYADTPRLKKIYIFNNQLETINIYDLPALQYMDCRENPMPDELYDEMDRMQGVTFLHDGNAEDW